MFRLTYLSTAIVLLTLLLPVTGLSVDLGPDRETEVGEVIDLSAQGLTQADTGRAVIRWYPRDRVRCKPYIPWGQNPVPAIEFSARLPGKYMIAVTAVINGQLTTDEVEITVTGTGPGPDPDPPDPGPTPGKKKWAFFVESGTLPSLPFAQQQLLASLRLRQEASKDGHSFIGSLDPNQMQSAPAAYVPWIKAVEGKALPILAVQDTATGTIKTYALPDNEATFWQAMGGKP